MVTAKIVLVLVYLWMEPDKSVDVKVDKVTMPSIDECYERGQKMIDLQVQDPRFVKGIAADCVALTLTDL